MKKIINLFIALRGYSEYSLAINGNCIEIKNLNNNNIIISMNNGNVSKIYLNNKKLSFDNYRTEELTQLMKW